MNDSDKKRFAEIIGLMCLAYTRDNPPELMRLYFTDLQEFSIGQVQAACERIRKSSAAHFPRVGEIIAAIKGERKLMAHEEWARVVGSINALAPDGRQYHASNPPKFEDQRTHRALAVIGGYKHVCHSPMENQQWLQKRFVEAYEAADDSFQREKIQQIGRDDAKTALADLKQKAIEGK